MAKKKITEKEFQYAWKRRRNRPYEYVMDWRKKHPNYKKEWTKLRIMHFKREYLEGRIRYDEIPKSYMRIINPDPSVWKNRPDNIEKTKETKAKRDELRRIIG